MSCFDPRYEVHQKVTKFKLKSGGFGEKYTLVNNILGNVTKYSEHLYPKEIALVSVISLYSATTSFCDLAVL